MQLKSEKYLSSVNANANSLKNDVNFKHIVEHVLSCTLEKDDKDVSSCVGLRFEQNDEMLNVGQMTLY